MALNAMARCIVLVMASVLGALPATAQTWPSGPIKIVVPFPAGGSVDMLPRLLQAGLQERLKVPVIIENKPGAAGMIGAAAVAKAEPDGNTFLVIADTLAASPALNPNAGFDVEKDLAPVLLVGTTPYVLATGPNKPYRNLADVIAAARAKPDTITYGSYGTGSGAHLAMLQLARNAGVSLLHAPYKGSAPSITDAIAGHIDLVISTPSNILPYLKSGKLRAIAQFGDARPAAMKDIPTTAESGYRCNECVTWYAFFTRSGTPRPIIERFKSELMAVLNELAVEKQVTDNMQITMLLKGPDGLKTFLADQIRIWGNVVRTNNVKVDQ